MASPVFSFYAHPPLLTLVRLSFVKTAWASELDRPEEESILAQPFIHRLTLGKLHNFYDFQLAHVQK